MKKHFILTAFIVLLVNSSIAQSGLTLDSLSKILAREIEDTLHVYALNEASFIISRSSPDSSLILSTKAKNLSEKLDYSEG